MITVILDKNAQHTLYFFIPATGFRAKDETPSVKVWKILYKNFKKYDFYDQMCNYDKQYLAQSKAITNI